MELLPTILATNLNHAQASSKNSNPTQTSSIPELDIEYILK